MILIGEMLPGYYDDESIIYVRKEITTHEVINGVKSEYTAYWLTKYNFKEVNGQYKIFTRKDCFMFADGLNDQKLSEEEFNSRMKRFEYIYNVEGGIDFPYVFDMRGFCEENLY